MIYNLKAIQVLNGLIRVRQDRIDSLKKEVQAHKDYIKDLEHEAQCLTDAIKVLESTPDTDVGPGGY